MADWSKALVNFLDVTASIAEGIIETDLHVNLLTATNVFCQSFCRPFYSKKGIPYNQALRLVKNLFK